MDGTGVPLVTPFTEEGAVDEDALRDLTAWVEGAGIDFLVPCGSTSEAPLLTDGERERVIAAVAEAADGPVLAGAGKESLADTLAATERAAEAGADAALVVTPHYFDYGQDALTDYYRDVADESPLPVYLYSVPPYTDVALSPETVGAVADHENVAGIKDSSGDLARLQRTLDRVPDDFDVLVGNGSVYAAGLDAGAAGGVLAVANAAPERASEIYRRHRDGDDEAARAINRDLVELDGVLGERGIPAVKAAVRERGRPGGYPRPPFQRLDEEDEAAVARIVDERT